MGSELVFVVSPPSLSSFEYKTFFSWVARSTKIISKEPRRGRGCISIGILGYSWIYITRAVPRIITSCKALMSSGAAVPTLGHIPHLSINSKLFSASASSRESSGDSLRLGIQEDFILSGSLALTKLRHSKIFFRSCKKACSQNKNIQVGKIEEISITN